MINYSKTTIALGLLTMLGTNPVAAADAISAARVETTDANDNLPKLNVSFPQYTYRYTTDDYQTFVQPTPVGDVGDETPTITTTNAEIATVNGNAIALTGKTGLMGITYTYPATDSHAETTAYYSVIVTAAEPTLVGTASEWNKVIDSGDNCANIKLTSDITLDTNNKTFDNFSGILDGDGHTITIDFNNSNEMIGLFRMSQGAYIKNLRVAGKIINTSKIYPPHIGGLFGSTASSDRGTHCVETVIENCMSSVEINANHKYAYVGGFIGTPQDAFTIKKCLFDGKITSSGFYGRFVCDNWDYEGKYYKSTITHCLSAGNIDCGNSVYNSKASINEDVYVADNRTEDLSDGAKLAVNDELLDGSFCYKVLNENNAGGPWKQHIGYENYPSLSSQYVVKKANNVYPNISVKANSLLTMALPVSIPAKNYQSENKVKIYTVDGAEDNVLQLVEFTEETIPAGLPVILYNTSSSDISFYASLLNTVYYNDEQTDKLLQTVYFSGNDKNVFYAPAGSYVLQKKKDDKFPAFYKVQNDNQIKIAQFKCYLKAPLANAAPCFYLPMYGTTGIDSVESDGSFEGDGKIYDLSGRRVSEMQKGQIYIIGGHKVMVK